MLVHNKKKAGLLARLIICSIISFLCFWIPVYYAYKYREYDNRMGLMFPIAAPILAFSAAFSVKYIKQLFNELRTSKRLNLYVIGTIGVILCLPNLVAIVSVIFIIIRIIVLMLLI